MFQTKPDILIVTAPRPPHLDLLEQRYRLHRFDLGDEGLRGDMLEHHGPDIRAAVISSVHPFDRALIDRLPRLELVASSAAGYENVDTAALQERGIALTTGARVLCDDVADAGILLMMAARRDLVRAHAYVADGEWGRKGMFPLQSSLRGKRLGVVGMGTIGQALAARAGVFGLDIAYHARRSVAGVALRHEPDLVALAHWCDILTVIVPGGAATRHLVDERVLRAIGPSGTLVNVSRGSVVDEAALVQALSDGGLGSAALDVFENEPRPEAELTALPNVTLSPHHASGTVETRAAMAQQIIDNLDAHFSGRPLISRIL